MSENVNNTHPENQPENPETPETENQDTAPETAEETFTVTRDQMEKMGKPPACPARGAR